MSTQHTNYFYHLSEDAQFLQSSEWAAFQEALGERVVSMSGNDWHWSAIIRKRRYGVYLDVPYGPTASSKKAHREAIKALMQCAKSEHAVFIRIEPIGAISEDILKEFGAERASKNFQPQHTSVINLELTIDELKSALNKGRKSAVNRAIKKEVQYEDSTNPKDIEDFLAMIHETYKRTGITAHPDSHYQIAAKTLLPTGKARLYFAVYNGKRIASIFGIDSPTTRYYLYAASFAEARDVEAVSYLAWQTMIDAKHAGLKRFDFFGVAPPDQPNHPWAGFSHFKQSFGGEIVERIGTWEIPVNKPLYKTLHMIKSIRSHVKR